MLLIQPTHSQTTQPSLASPKKYAKKLPKKFIQIQDYLKSLEKLEISHLASLKNRHLGSWTWHVWLYDHHASTGFLGIIARLMLTLFPHLKKTIHDLKKTQESKLVIQEKIVQWALFLVKKDKKNLCLFDIHLQDQIITLHPSCLHKPAKPGTYHCHSVRFEGPLETEDGESFIFTIDGVFDNLQSFKEAVVKAILAEPPIYRTYSKKWDQILEICPLFLKDFLVISHPSTRSIITSLADMPTDGSLVTAHLKLSPITIPAIVTSSQTGTWSLSKKITFDSFNLHRGIYFTTNLTGKFTTLDDLKDTLASAILNLPEECKQHYSPALFQLSPAQLKDYLHIFCRINQVKTIDSINHPLQHALYVHVECPV